MNILHGVLKNKLTIIVTLLFLVCIAAAMAANVYFANKINTTSFLISKTYDQKGMIQRLSKALLRVHTQRNVGRSYQLDLTELSYAYEQFNNTLYKQSLGGTIKSANNKYKINKITDEQGIDILKRAILVWTDIKLALTPLQEPESPVTNEKVRAVMDIVNAYSVQVMGIMDELNAYYREQNMKHTKLLYLSYLASIFFMLILVIFLLTKARKKSTQYIEQPKAVDESQGEQEFNEAEEMSIPHQMEMPIDFPASGHATLTQFLSDVENNLQLAEPSLLTIENADESIEQMLEPISNIKQLASSMGCPPIEKVSSELLDELQTLQSEDKVLTELKLTELQDKFAELHQNHQQFVMLISDEQDKDKASKKQTPQSQYNDWLALKDLTTELAQRANKKAELHLHGLQTELPEHYHRGLMDISEQLIRNSITHGIELTETRLTALKPEFGQITITLKPSAEHGYEFIYEDDGQGINYEEIRKAIVLQGFASQEIANNMNKNELAAYIFKLGFSTLSNTSIDSGGGIGMDIIKHTIDKLGGKTIVLSVVNKNTRFTVVLPPSYAEEEQDSLLNTA